MLLKMGVVVVGCIDDDDDDDDDVGCGGYNEDVDDDCDK
jgi:hypothetical protein